MSNNYDLLINKDNNNIEPFDKIEQGTKRYIPNIPSVISDMKKNNININSEIKGDNFKENKEIITSNKEEIKINEIKENNLDINYDNQNKQENENGIKDTIANYWNTFRNNQTVSIIINPFQDDSECANKVYKIYSCITLSLIFLVILLSITLS